MEILWPYYHAHPTLVFEIYIFTGNRLGLCTTLRKPNRSGEGYSLRSIARIIEYRWLILKKYQYLSIYLI